MIFLSMFASLALYFGSALVTGLPQQTLNSKVQGFTANNICGGWFYDVAAISGTIDYWVGKDEAGQPEKTCVWLIIESSLTEGYEVKITDLKLAKNNKNCKNGKISINTFVHDNGTALENHILCETTDDWIQVNGNAMAIIMKTKKAVKGHGLRLEWRRSGEYLGIQKPVRAETSFNKPDNLEWPSYDSDNIGINNMRIYAFPKGNQSEATDVMKAVFQRITFDKPSTVCTDEFMMITAIEDGALRLLETVCDTRPAGLTYESYGGFVFFVSTNAKWGTLYGSDFQFTYRTIDTLSVI